jgi:hypothetical protein
MKRLRIPPLKELPREVYDNMLRTQHELGRTSPVVWKLCAYQLIRAAEAMVDVPMQARARQWERMAAQRRDGKKHEGSRTLVGQERQDAFDEGMFAVYLMLCGMAFECVLKGLLVARDPNGAIVTSHDLLILIGLLKVKLSDREIELLGIMSDHIEWKGRYPVPIQVAAMPSIASRANPEIPAQSFWPQNPPGMTNHPEDRPILIALFQKLFSELDAARTQNPQ